VRVIEPTALSWAIGAARGESKTGRGRDIRGRTA
jgi:hypothetical protein